MKSLWLCLAAVLAAALVAPSLESDVGGSHPSSCAARQQAVDRMCDAFGPASGACHDSKQRLGPCAAAEQGAMKVVPHGLLGQEQGANTTGVTQQRGSVTSGGGGRVALTEKQVKKKKKCAQVGWWSKDSKSWKANAMSPLISVAFHGNSDRKERYKASPPGCPSNFEVCQVCDGAGCMTRKKRKLEVKAKQARKREIATKEDKKQEMAEKAEEKKQEAKTKETGKKEAAAKAKVEKARRAKAAAERKLKTAQDERGKKAAKKSMAEANAKEAKTKSAASKAKVNADKAKVNADEEEHDEEDHEDEEYDDPGKRASQQRLGSSSRTTTVRTTKGRCADAPSLSRPTRASVVTGYKNIQWVSKCEYYKSRLRQCHYYKKSCAKTCQGKGRDKYTKPYTERRKVTKRKQFASRCAYFKSVNLCQRTYYKRHCARTCGTCTSSKPLSAAVQRIIQRGSMHTKKKQRTGTKKKQRTATKKKQRGGSVVVAANSETSCVTSVGFKGVHCWGDNRNAIVSGAKKGTKDYTFRSLSLGPTHACAVPRNAKGVLCWGFEMWAEISGQDSSNGGRISNLRRDSKCDHLSFTRRQSTSHQGVFRRCSLHTNTQFTSVSSARYWSCAVAKNKPGLVCWGYGSTSKTRNSYKPTKRPWGKWMLAGAATWKGIRFRSVALSADGKLACAVPRDKAGIMCWGADVKYSHVVPGLEADKNPTCKDLGESWTGQQKTRYVACVVHRETKFVSVSVAPNHACAVAEKGGLVCWGNDKRKAVRSLLGSPKCRTVRSGPYWAGQVRSCVLFSGKKFTSVTAYGEGFGHHSKGHTCAVPRGEKGLWCWGFMDGSDQRQSDKDKQLSPINGGIKDKKCREGGNNRFLGGSCRLYSRLRFSSVTTAKRHTCAVVKPPHVAVRCWGSNTNGQVQGLGVDDAPKGLQLYQEPSCMAQHPAKSGPTSCTSCPQNRQFTIVDPRTNTGTCTKEPCPNCKPRACCGPHHKHFVINTDSLMGACVRYSDDCTPICIPRSDYDHTKKRVCSKGCNQLIKVDKQWTKSNPRPNTNDESKLFDIVVCQAQKRVICTNSPAACRNAKKTDLCKKCRTESIVKAGARCPFTNAVWNLGGTCIASHVHNIKGAPCQKEVVEFHKKAGVRKTLDELKTCTKATKQDHVKCSRLAMTF